MTDREIEANKKIFAGRYGVSVEKVYVIPKSELVKGEIYQGECRNSDSARWDEDKFLYARTKFGSTYLEAIHHFEDDDGYDVFVPMKII